MVPAHERARPQVSAGRCQIQATARTCMGARSVTARERAGGWRMESALDRSQPLPHIPPEYLRQVRRGARLWGVARGPILQ